MTNNLANFALFLRDIIFGCGNRMKASYPFGCTSTNHASLGTEGKGYATIVPLTISWTRLLSYSNRPGGRLVRRKATMMASSSLDSVVDLACLGPMGRSLTDARLFHLTTVLGLIPYRLTSMIRLA